MNIAELLKNAQPGLKLYSPVCGDCTFQKVEGGDIFVLGDREYIFQFDGRYGTNGECLLFPSKDKMDWSDFKLPVKVLEEGALVMFSTYENPISFIQWQNGLYAGGRSVKHIFNGEECLTLDCLYIVPFDDFYSGNPLSNKDRSI